MHGLLGVNRCLLPVGHFGRSGVSCRVDCLMQLPAMLRHFPPTLPVASVANITSTTPCCSFISWLELQAGLLSVRESLVCHVHAACQQ